MSPRPCLYLLLVLLALTACNAPTPSVAPEPGGAGANAVAEVVNRYRRSRGLPVIALSPALTRVAAAHVADLEAHYRKTGTCNMHSWSKNGNWSACCYTPDHRQAACMWNKPKEITGGAYSAPGYEIVAHYTDPMTPAMALEIWKDSPGHHAMILNSGTWSAHPWRAMGAAIGTHFAVVWFGEAADATAR